MLTFIIKKTFAVLAIFKHTEATKHIQREEQLHAI